MNTYTILITSDNLAESLAEELNNLKNGDSVINAEDKISVITEYNEGTDFDVFVGIGDTANEHVKCLPSISKPVLLCDVDCTKLDEVNSGAIPSTWGLFSRGNKDKETAFLKHFNLSFVYNEGADKVRDYIAPLVFHMLEEFSFHNKYNDNFAYKKQAEFIHEFTQFYLDKMKRLAEAEGFVREDIKGDFNHIVYRYRPDDAEKPFRSIDGRDYDFIIEYHRNKPSEGIYYGVKGEVTSGNLEEQCEKFRKEWPCIFMKTHKDRENCLTDLQKATTDILNDTFLWKDFLCCFKPTDNFNRKRYWLFWITLNDDEDIISVAALAVKLISRTFEEYLWGNNDFEDREATEKKQRGRPKKTNKKNDNYLRIPYFSNEAYKLLFENYSGSKETLSDWIGSLESNGIIQRERLFDKCYRLNIDSDDFINDYVRSSANEQKIRSPFIKKQKNKDVYHYDLLDRLFLPKDGIKSIGNFRQIKKN